MHAHNMFAHHMDYFPTSVSWVCASVAHALGMAVLQFSWVLTPDSVLLALLPCSVLVYWHITGGVCHLTQLEKRLHPRGLAAFSPIPWWSTWLVAVNQTLALLALAHASRT